jgi:hypothetical protein
MPELADKNTPKPADPTARLVEKPKPTLDQFRTPQGYDLVAALKAGVPESALGIFGTGAIQDARSFIATEKQLEPYRTDEGYDVAAAIKAGVKPSTLEGFGLPSGAVSEARLAVQYEQKLAPFKTKEGYDLIAIVKEGAIPEAALVRYATPKAIAEAKTIAATSIQVGPKNEWINKDTWEKLSAADKKFAQESGLLALERRLEGRRVMFERTHVEVRPDEWLPAAEFRKLSAGDKALIRDVGIERFNQIKATEVAEQKLFGRPFIQIQTMTGPMMVPKEVAGKYAARVEKAIDWEGLSEAELRAMWDRLSLAQKEYAIDRGLAEFSVVKEAQAERAAVAAALKALEKAGAVTETTVGPPGKEEVTQEYDIQRALDKGVTRKQLERVFGKDTVEKQWKIFVATHPTAAPRAPRPSDREFANLVKPPAMSARVYSKIAPFVKPEGVDVIGAVKAGVPDLLIQRVAGVTKKDLDDSKWVAAYEDANWAEKIGMAVKKDPVGTAKEMGLAMIPAYGTMRLWEGMAPGWKALSIFGDLVFFVPIVNQVSAAVKAGTSIGRAALRGTVVAARDTVVAPYTLARHPVQSAKAFVAPLEVLIRRNRLPLAATWRGSYSKNMDMTKVLAGVGTEEQLATRKAMEALLKRIEAGEVAFDVPVGGIGALHYSGTGLQKVLKGVTGTSTPYGPSFKGVGLKAQGEGLFTAPEHFLGFSFATATGKSPLYVFKGDKVIGVVAETGKVLDDHGKVIGRLAKGTEIIGMDGKPIGKLTTDFKVVDKAGKAIGEYKNGAVVTTDAKLIGKLYKGQPHIVKHKVVGVVNKDGVVVDKAGKVVVRDLEKVVGYVPEGAKIVSETGKALGKGKAQPIFALIQTQGLQELPKWVMEAKTMGAMEKRAWQLFKSGKYGGDLYPVFKQYAKWIELEALLPPGTRIIPVVGSNGKPIVMFTRDLAGRKIEIPLMQVVSKDWLEKSKAITLALQGKAKALKPQMSIERMLSRVKDLPKPKKAAPAVAAWFRRNPQARLVGSTVEYLYTTKFRPADLDMGVPNPAKAAKGLAGEIEKATGVKVKVNIRKDKTAMLEWFDKKQGLWRAMANVKRPGKYETAVVGGVRVETLGSQAARTLARMESEFGGKGYARFARLARALGEDADIGIGAKPPTLKQLLELKARGIGNTVRDIFIKGLTKKTRLARTAEIAPDLTGEVKAMMRVEERLAKARVAQANAARTAARQGTLSLRATARVLARLNRRVEELTTEYERVTVRLRDRLQSRARVLSTIARTLPARATRAAERTYRDMLRASAYTPARERVSLERARPPRTTMLPARARVRDTRITRPARAAELGREVVRAPRDIRAARQLARVRVAPTEPLRGRPPRVRVKPPVREPPPWARPPEGVRPPPRPGFPDREAKPVEPAQAPVTWRQGNWWITIHPPYKKGDVRWTKHPPRGAIRATGKGSAYKTIQALGADGRVVLTADMGIMDVQIIRPRRKPSKAAIRFRRDPKQKTKSDISLSLSRVRGGKPRKKSIDTRPRKTIVRGW